MGGEGGALRGYEGSSGKVRSIMCFKRCGVEGEKLRSSKLDDVDVKDGDIFLV